jgi:hypothetical protein
MDRNLSPRKFNNEADLVASRTMTVDGSVVNRGDLLPADLGHSMRLRLWMSGRALYKTDFRPTPVAGDPGTEEVEVQEDDGIAVVHSGGAWYLVSAPWLDEPEKVQGKDAAEARAEELRSEGAPAVETEAVEGPAEGPPPQE